MLNKKNLVMLSLLICLSFFGLARAVSFDPEETISLETRVHYLNTMMNNGLIMSMEGSNLSMLAGMNMAPAIDQQTSERGEELMRRGKRLVEEALTGPDMVDIYVSGSKDYPAVRDIRSLGDYILKAAYSLDNMYEDAMTNEDVMTIHHMHVLINNALSAAAEGANMIILGKLDLAGRANLSVQHGKEMLKEARVILLDLLTGEAMQNMHRRGFTVADHKSMLHTHEHIHNGLKIIDKLNRW